MSDSTMVTTPVEGATTTVETETVETTTTETQNVEDTRDYASELNTKDNTIAQLRAQLDAAGDNREQKDKLSLELANAISERGNLARERDEAIASRSSAIDTLTTATETLIDHSGELQKRIREYEAQIANEQKESKERLGKLTKYEVLTKEFQHLLPYADRIVNSEDPEKVRADARAFAETRESDLDTYKRALSGASMGATGERPTTPEQPVTIPEDSEARLAFLRSKMNDPKAFESALAEMRNGYEQTRALAS